MNLLIISNADSCRSRIAQALLSSFGKGMKVYILQGQCPQQRFIRWS
ncbi:hypothetical protein O1359_15600 [Bacteroides fragilis]|nr:hypothetical protein [Bacteroides fragilis]